MRELDLNLLHVLVAIDQHRSVSAAAVALRRSQPSVSVALRKLRDYFDDPLFVRTGNVMQPTRRAASLIRSAQSVLARVNLDIVAASAFDPLANRSVVTFALSDVGEVVVLPAIMKELRRQMPQAPIRSLSLPAHQVASELEGGGVDLAIGYFPDLKTRNFYQQVLYFDTFACLIRAGHPIAAETLNIKQYLQLGMRLLKRTGTQSRRPAERVLTARSLRRGKRRLTGGCG